MKIFFKGKVGQELGRNFILLAILLFMLFLVLVVIYSDVGKIIISNLKKILGFW